MNGLDRMWADVMADIERISQEMAVPRAWVKPEPDPKFPHKCPRCGGRAYITGMNTVEHENVIRGATCR